MTPAQSFPSIPIFCTAGNKVAIDSTTQSIGYQPQQQLPCEYYNQLENQETTGLNTVFSGLANITAELDALVISGGLTPSITQSAQVLSGIMNLITNATIPTYGPYIGNTVIQSTGGAYALSAWGAKQVICMFAGATTVSLPAASTCVGFRTKILAAYVGSGLVTITPNGTDKIGSAGNVSCYLQNVDQGGNPFYFQSLELLACESGYWAVVAGQFCPAQSVDTNGSQYHLGKLHHLPLVNTTSRNIVNQSSLASGWSGAVQTTGVLGVPSGAKAVRVKAILLLNSTAAGGTTEEVGFSDNNSNVPSENTSHGVVGGQFNAAGANNPLKAISEIDIPLNSLGQFYYNVFTQVNVSGVTNTLSINIVGYYMGD